MAQDNEFINIDIGEPAVPTDAAGVTVDFNYGARVRVPAGSWLVRVINQETCMILGEFSMNDRIIVSPQKYFIDFRIEIYQEGALQAVHTYDALGKRVVIRNCSKALGDTIAWTAYVEAFRRQHGCTVYFAVEEKYQELLQESYPEIRFIGRSEKVEGAYATYYLGTFKPEQTGTMQPVDWRIAGMQQTAAAILGLPRRELRTQLRLPHKRLIAEPYVCIAAQSSAQAKYWNNPTGWYETVVYLKQCGYRVLCIDQLPAYGRGIHWNHIPYGAEDCTGSRPLKERAQMLAEAEFFIGLGSGLSWLAWAAGCPVILISGFALPYMEFSTPYRCINYEVCNGCFTDSRVEFDREDFTWCPRHKGDSEQFICTRAIPAAMVQRQIERLRQDRAAGHRERENTGDLQKTACIFAGNIV